MATPALSQSPKLYQERKQPELRVTRRRPGPRFDMDADAVHDLPLAPPLPTPEALHAEGHKPPDAGLTDVWPWGGSADIV